MLRVIRQSNLTHVAVTRILLGMRVLACIVDSIGYQLDTRAVICPFVLKLRSTRL